MAKRNLALAYVSLIGVPLLIMVLTLQIGAALNAPISIAGVWRVRLDAAGSQACGCSKMSVEQSGTSVILTLDDVRKTKFTGAMDRERFTAADYEGSARMEAVVTGTAPRRAIQGTFIFERCATCAPARFSATRPGSDS